MESTMPLELQMCRDLPSLPVELGAVVFEFLTLAEAKLLATLCTDCARFFALSLRHRSTVLLSSKGNAALFMRACLERCPNLERFGVQKSFHPLTEYLMNLPFNSFQDHQVKPNRKLHIYALKVRPFANSMENFRSLTLCGAKLDSLLSLGSVLPNLTQLHIERSQMSWKPGVDLVALSGAFPHLTDLSLGQCWLQIPTEEFFASRATVFRRLESLRLYLRCALEPDDYFLVLSLFPADALRRFSVCIVAPIRPPLPLEVVQFLCARFKNLVHCELGRENEYWPGSDTMLQSLSHLERFAGAWDHHFTLFDTPGQCLPEMKALKICKCPKRYASLSQCAPNLTALQVSRGAKCGPPNSDLSHQLFQLSSLRYLRISEARMSVATLENFATLKRLEHLELYSVRFEVEPREGFDVLSRSLSAIPSKFGGIVVFNCGFPMHSDALRGFFERLPNLEFARVSFLRVKKSKDDAKGDDEGSEEGFPELVQNFRAWAEQRAKRMAYSLTSAEGEVLLESAGGGQQFVSKLADMELESEFDW